MSEHRFDDLVGDHRANPAEHLSDPLDLQDCPAQELEVPLEFAHRHVGE